MATHWYGNTQLSVISKGQPTLTDANGEYRFEVTSGEYFVRTVTTDSDANWHTYFPGTMDPAKAESLRVAPGADVSADILLAKIPASKISIRITDLISDRGNRHIAAFYLTDRNATVREVEYVPAGCTCPPSGPFAPSIPFATLSADSFEIRGVRPGTYELRAVMWIGDTNPYVFRLYKPGEPIPVIPTYDGRTTVEVIDSDVGATVEIRRAVPLSQVDVKGRVTSNGKSVPKDTVLVFLKSVTDNTTGYLSLVDRSGRFTIPGVREGSYQFSFELRSPDAYVEDVRQGGVSILNSGLTISKSPAVPLDVLVNPSGGVIDGVIQNGGPALVALIPVAGQNAGRTTKVANANASGDFKFRGIPPGDYRILAFKNTSLNGIDGGAIYSPHFTNRYASQSVPVNVQPGVPMTLRVTSITP